MNTKPLEKEWELKMISPPTKVVYAVRILYLVVGIGIIRTSITVVQYVDVRSPYFLIFTKGLVYVGSLLLINQLTKGKNWARWSLVVIFLISIPLNIIPAIESISFSPLHPLLSSLQLGLHLIALFFLFHKSSSEWYHS